MGILFSGENKLLVYRLFFCKNFFTKEVNGVKSKMYVVFL